MSKSAILGLLLTLAIAVSTAQGTQSQNDPTPPRRGDATQKREPAEKAAETKQPKKGGQPSSVRAGTRINAELESALDARTAKPGDEVSARVTKDVKQDGQVVIHKGDRLLGRVTEVQAAGEGKGESRLGVAFDRLVQGETTTQLNAVIKSVVSTPSEDRARREEMMREPEPMATPSRSRPRQGGGSSGGLVGSAASTLNSTVGATAGAVGRTTGSVGAAGQGSLGSATGAAVSTPLRALRVDSRAQGQAGTSSVLSSRDGHVALESGSRLQLQVVGEAASSANRSGK